MNDLGQSFVVDIDPNMELENVMALLEVEVRPLFYIISRSYHELVRFFMSSRCLDLPCFFSLGINQSGIPTNEQSISYEGKDLSNPKATLQEYGVKDKGMLYLRRKVQIAGR